MDRAQGFPQGFAEDEGHDLQGRGLFLRIIHQGRTEGGAAFFRRLVQAVRNRRDQTHSVGQAQKDFPGLQRLSRRFDNGPPHLEEDAGKSQGEKGPVPGFVPGAGGKDVVGQDGRFRHRQLGSHQQVQTLEGLFISRGIGIGAQGIGGRDEDRSHPIRMIGQDLLRHGIRREGSGYREKIRGRRPSGFGLAFIGMGARRHQMPRENQPPGDADAAADGQEDRGQVGGSGAVAVHEEAEVVAQRGAPGGEEPADFADLIVIELAGPARPPARRIPGTRACTCSKPEVWSAI